MNPFYSQIAFTSTGGVRSALTSTITAPLLRAACASDAAGWTTPDVPTPAVQPIAGWCSKLHYTPTLPVG
jgi:hypothetical protein